MFGKNDCRLTDGDIAERAEELMSRMTLKEKVYLLNGVWDIVRNQLKYRNAYNPVPIKTKGNRRLGIAPIAFTDGPRGVVMGRSTCFPVSMARGASFDRELERRIGDAIGREARAQGANYFGGVCVNLLRHPAWGRAQETYGEDPFLVGEMGAMLTRGVQRHNVIACVKHYALNNIENSRFKVNVTTDERTLREVYLPHFRKCIEAGAGSVMGAYNRFRGEQCCENRHLLTRVLRDEWGFEGFTISDFVYGVRDTVRAIEAGLDVEMPMPIHYHQRLLGAVRSGDVPEETVDAAVRRVLKTQIAFTETPDPQHYPRTIVACDKHVRLAREAAEQSMVLIRNEGGVLPFDRSRVRRALVIGSLAARENTGDHGSSRVYAPYVVSPLDGIRRHLGDGVEVLHCTEDEGERARTLAAESDCVVIVVGNDYNDEGEYVVMEKGDGEHPVVVGMRNQGMPLKALLVKSLMRKLSGDVKQDGEPVGGDRRSLRLKPSEQKIIDEVGGANPNTVVVLVCGSMILTSPWDQTVSAVLYGWYAGMEGGNALARVLFGDAVPGGKLPFTIPYSEDDLPFFSSTDREIEYGRYHGYTLLDQKSVRAAYPFGFGLSYTVFETGEVQVEPTQSGARVALTLSNRGAFDAAEVIQVYVGKPDSEVDRPVKELKGFAKVFVRAGGSEHVQIDVDHGELTWFDPEAVEWVFEPGTYRFYVGTSSDDRMLTAVDVRLDS